MTQKPDPIIKACAAYFEANNHFNGLDEKADQERYNATEEIYCIVWRNLLLMRPTTLEGLLLKLKTLTPDGVDQYVVNDYKLLVETLEGEQAATLLQAAQLPLATTDYSKLPEPDVACVTLGPGR